MPLSADHFLHWVVASTSRVYGCLVLLESVATVLEQHNPQVQKFNKCSSECLHGFLFFSTFPFSTISSFHSQPLGNPVWFSHFLSPLLEHRRHRFQEHPASPHCERVHMLLRRKLEGCLWCLLPSHALWQLHTPVSTADFITRWEPGCIPMADHCLKKELFLSSPRSFLFSHCLSRLLDTISWCVEGRVHSGGKCDSDGRAAAGWVISRWRGIENFSTKYKKPGAAKLSTQAKDYRSHKWKAGQIWIHKIFITSEQGRHNKIKRQAGKWYEIF